MSFKNEALIATDMETKGVALSVLQELTSHLPNGATFHDAKKLILGITKKTGGARSLVSHLTQEDKTEHLVGNATCFVSYAWSGSFHATIGAITEFFKDKPMPFLWIDIAMVDQHAAETIDVDFQVWAKTFKDSLKKIGNALLVLTPGEKPIAIGRSWCCFEWVCIKQTGIHFDYCVSQIDVERWITQIENGDAEMYAKFQEVFAGINVEQATAFKLSDQKAILKLMREVGIKEVNDVIMLSVKDWLLEAINQGQQKAQEGTVEGTRFLNAKALLHQVQGEFDLACPLLEQALASARRVIPDNPDLVSTQMDNLADLYSKMGDYSKAERLYRQTIKKYQKILGDDHPTVADSLVGLASILQDKGHLKRAEKLYRQALAIHKKALGDNHPDVATDLGNLASLLHDKGEYAEAEPLYKEALAIDKKALGDNHPEVSSDLSNLAGLYHTLGRTTEAKLLFEEALRINRLVLGEKHLDVANPLMWLATIAQDEGDLQTALVNATEALEIRKAALAPKHSYIKAAEDFIAGLKKPC